MSRPALLSALPVANTDTLQVCRATVHLHSYILTLQGCVNPRCQVDGATKLHTVVFNLLQPTGGMAPTGSKPKNWHSAHTVLTVLYLSENKQHLVPLTA
jgi:hypothetical protein